MLANVISSVNGCPPRRSQESARATSRVGVDHPGRGSECAIALEYAAVRALQREFSFQCAVLADHAIVSVLGLRYSREFESGFSMELAGWRSELRRELNRELDRRSGSRCSTEFAIKFSVELTATNDRSTKRRTRIATKTKLGEFSHVAHSMDA